MRRLTIGNVVAVVVVILAIAPVSMHAGAVVNILVVITVGTVVVFHVLAT